MAKKILFVLRISVLVIFCGLGIYFHFTDNRDGISLITLFFLFINLLLSVLRDNITKTEDKSEGNTKNRQPSKKEKIFDIAAIIILAIFILFSLLHRRLNINADFAYVFILPAIVVWGIVIEVVNYKRDR